MLRGPWKEERNKKYCPSTQNLRHQSSTYMRVYGDNNLTGGIKSGGPWKIYNRDELCKEKTGKKSEICKDNNVETKTFIPNSCLSKHNTHNIRHNARQITTISVCIWQGICETKLVKGFDHESKLQSLASGPLCIMHCGLASQVTLMLSYAGYGARW